MPPKSKKAEKPDKKGKGKEAPQPEADVADTPADRLRKEGIITTYALSNKTIHRNVRDISITNLTVTFHGNPLFEEAELTLNYGNRYGFIGRNGTGKSTFMRVIAARSFPIPDGIDIFHLKEEIEATDMTAKEAVMSVDRERSILEAEAEELNDILANEEGSEEADDALERLTQVYERLEELDSATAETRASKILSGLGFTPAKQNKMTKEFSGGWRMRIALARALFIQPTLLLLDEPTNHLDMEAVVWLEDYLSKWKKILFLVSHSQDFLNNVCTHIVHLHKKKLLYYSGNYDQFIKTRNEKEEEQEKRYKSEQDQIKHMKNYIARFGQGNAKMAKQAQSKEKTLDKMMRGGLTDKVEGEKALDFKFPDPPNLAPPVLQCNNITFGYPGCEILYSNVDFGVDLDSRVALVGPNGAGKSTLLKVMTGELVPITGSVRPHPHLRIAKFSQHFVDVLDLNLSPLDYFMSLWPDLTREDGRKFLGRFGVSGHVQTQVMAQLSDGQKSRVVLAKMAKECPHMLFLDEPTNHLDMESIDSLAKAINQFTGGMVLVSHDMRLISQVAKEIWLCDNKTVAKYVGEISDFKMQLRKQIIDGVSLNEQNTTKSDNLLVAPLIPKKLIVEDVQIAPMTVAPPAPPVVEKKVTKQQTQEDDDDEVFDLSPEEEAKRKEDEKAAAKARKKAEKEAAMLLAQREEEERQRRREEKLREAEEAKQLKELEAKLRENERLKKEAEEAAQKQLEEEDKRKILEYLAMKKQEKEKRKQEKLQKKLYLLREQQMLFESAVLEDVWTQTQQTKLEEALFLYPASLSKQERWTSISKHLENEKSKQQCLARYKYLKELVRLRKENPSITSIVVNNNL